ncbi:MAG: glycosyltransferase 87 family protein [Cyanobacteria bacterium P01_F01_bin.13]
MNGKFLSLILLLLLSLNTWVARLPAAGIDFYHYWGVAKARQLSPSPLQNPYVASTAHADVLNQYADASNDQILKEANSYRRTLDLTGTPLLYTVSALLPESYSLAIKGFRLGQLVLFVLTIFLIGVLRGNSTGFELLALVLAATFSPFLSDVVVGNLNAIQLFLLVAAALLIERAQPQTSKARLRYGVMILCGLIFITLLKPNLLLSSLLLSAVFLRKYGLPRPTLLIPAGVAFTVLLLVATNVCLGSAQVWLDWYKLVSASQDRLAYPIEAGNYSTTLLLSQLYTLDIYTAVNAVAVFLIVSFCSIVAIAAIKQGSPLLGRSREIVFNILQDSGLVVSIAVTITFALSPLVWAHYYTLLLLPALWLLDTRFPWQLGNWLSLLAIIFASGGLVNLLSTWFVFSPEVYAVSFMLGWVWVWAGLLITVLKRALGATKHMPLATE